MKTSLFLVLMLGLSACGEADSDNASQTDEVQPSDSNSPGASGTFPADSPQAGCSDTPMKDGSCDPNDVCASLDPDCDNGSPFPGDTGGGAAGTFPEDSPLAGCSDTPVMDGVCDPEDVCAPVDPDCGSSLPPSEPTEDECDGEIVDTEADCLQDDAFCTELPSGKFCTGTDAPSCPENFEPATEGCPDAEVFWCFAYSESLDCKLGELSAEECTEAGGEVVGDPGDGSVSAKGCPNERTELGFVVPGGTEGALCCGK